MMKRNGILGAALLLAACSSLASADAPATPVAIPMTPVLGAAQTVLLRLKYTPGQTLYYRMNIDTVGTIFTGQSGAGMPLNQHMSMLMHQTVKDVRVVDGAATLDSGIDSMTMTMNGQAFPMPAETMASMKNIGTMVISPTGKTLSFTPSSAVSGMAMPGMDFTKMSSMSALGQLPEAAVKAGDTWNSAVSMGILGTSVAAHFTLGSIDTTGGKTVALVNQTTDGTFDTSTTKGVTGPMGMKMTGKANGTGVLHFDVDAGAIESQTSKIGITMNMTQPGATMPMKMKMKVTTSLTRTTAPPPTADPKMQ
jgi:hypothetical protein